jgi:hypothetical protein
MPALPRYGSDGEPAAMQAQWASFHILGKHIMRKSGVVVLLAVFVLTGCVATPPQQALISSPFDASATKIMLGKGSNTIRGSALIRQRGGGVVTCAGQQVILAPSTPYSNERALVIYGSTEHGYRALSSSPGGIVFIPDPQEYQTLTLRTVCDAQGYFKFEQVANGSFLVSTKIAWQVVDYKVEGGVLMQRVTVMGGETKEVVLSPH